MLKRLIEVSLPLKEVSEQSAREKSIRHGHISTLHIWWARRPLAACRAVVFASLIPDPDDPECPDHFRTLVMEILSRTEFKPRNGNGSAIEDTPRNRCLEFIKQLVKWENSNNPMYIEPARELIAAAHKFLHPDAESDAPKVLDPFAGGGAIPLEALRLGCETHAIDINPVAHLIELCTLVYPQKYGQPNSRPVPDYIKRLIAHNKAKKRAKGEQSLFDEGGVVSASDSGEIIPDVEITEEEYRKNPLLADVKYWSARVLECVHNDLGYLYDLDEIPGVSIAYLWARQIECPNPTCRGRVPLIRQLWLVRTRNGRQAIRMEKAVSDDVPVMRFSIASGSEIDFDPSEGTMSRNSASCPHCNTTIPKRYLEQVGKTRGFDSVPVAVVSQTDQGKQYFAPPDTIPMPAASEQALEEDIPNEELPYLRSIFNCHVYGLNKWSKLFSNRQLTCLTRFAYYIRVTIVKVRKAHSEDSEYAAAVAAYLAVLLDRLVDYNSSLCTWTNTGEKIGHTFGRQALGMVWDFCEVNPFSELTGSWGSHLRQVLRVIERCSEIPTTRQVSVSRTSALTVPFQENQLHAVITDPPYYDAVPYADLSDFFYVWLKRTLMDTHPDIVRTPLTPKGAEVVQLAGRNDRYKSKTADWFEIQMKNAFSSWRSSLSDAAVVCVMYAHKSTAAWESLVSGLTLGGFSVSASWPFHTEMTARLRGQGSAALASSVTLVCRKRQINAGNGIWDDIRQELKTVAQERLDFFWDQGIRGADFFISAIGPALSVFGKYERVTKLSGEEVTVGQFLDEVRSLVTTYALTKILKATHTGAIDPKSRFYVVWKWSYGGAKVPADESFKLSQALGFDTTSLWDKTGVLEKSGENVQANTIDKRIKIKHLGEPSADGTPASLIDALHRMCAFREKGDTQGMGEFLGRSGHTSNNSLWLVAQAVSEILPDGDKEKQLMQGLLNQKDGLEEAARERRLF